MKLSTTVASSGARSALKNHGGTTKVPQHSNTTTWSTIEEPETMEILFLGPLISEPFSGASTCVAIAVYWPSTGLCVPERLPLLRSVKHCPCLHLKAPPSAGGSYALYFPWAVPSVIYVQRFSVVNIFHFVFFSFFWKKKEKKAHSVQGGLYWREGTFYASRSSSSSFTFSTRNMRPRSVSAPPWWKKKGGERCESAWCGRLFNSLGDFVLRLLIQLDKKKVIWFGLKLLSGNTWEMFPSGVKGTAHTRTMSPLFRSPAHLPTKQ